MGTQTPSKGDGKAHTDGPVTVLSSSCGQIEMAFLQALLFPPLPQALAYAGTMSPPSQKTAFSTKRERAGFAFTLPPNSN